jgi:hypothetical protein
VRALIPFLTIIATVSTIVTAWWNLAIRKKYVEARIAHMSKDVVESGMARWARRIVTTIVLFFVCSALITGAVIFIKTLWELFS